MQSKSENFIYYLKLFTNIRLVTVLLLGFSSGMPLLLTSATLQSWYTKAGISIVAIGALSLVGWPYLLKFFWSPVMDKIKLPFLGRRRGWMLVTQILLLIFIAAMAFMNPKVHPIELGFLALIVAFFSASQDISINAYQTDILKPIERGPGAAMYVAGYRVAMILTGGIALILAQYIGWHTTYLIMAGFMVVGILGTLMAPQPLDDQFAPPTMQDAIVEPFKEFFSRENAFLILLFIVLYKLSYAMIQVMTPTFLLGAVHFSLADVGAVNKIAGLVATIIGVFVGGLYTAKLGVFRALLIFGFLQAVGNLLYMVLALVGHNYPLFVGAIVTENFFVGLETAVFVAFIMSLCDHRYTATQFALLSALAAVGRVLIGAPAGYVAEHAGWANYYLIAFLIIIPAMMLLLYLRKPIQKQEAEIKLAVQE